MKYPEILGKDTQGKTARVKFANGDGNATYEFVIGDVRLALSFLFFVHLGFFGIGKCVLSPLYLSKVASLTSILFTSVASIS